MTSLFLPWLGLTLLIGGILGQHNVASIDLWGKLAIPRLWFSTGQFPYFDPFSYTAGLHGHPARWIDHEWGAGVLWWLALRAGEFLGVGSAGLSLFKFALVGGMVAAVLKCVQRQGHSLLWPIAILLLGLQPLTTGMLTTGRPQIFTFALLPVLLFVLESVRLSKQYGRLLWLVPLSLLWVNLHGGYVAGLGCMVLYAAGEALNRHRFQPYLWAFAAMAGVALINPYGWDYVRFLLYAVTLPRPEITEWAAVPWTPLLAYWPIRLLTLVVGVGVLSNFIKCGFNQTFHPHPDFYCSDVAVKSDLLNLKDHLPLWGRGGGDYSKLSGNWTRAVILGAFCILALQHLKHQPLAFIAAACLLPGLFLAPGHLTDPDYFGAWARRLRQLERWILPAVSLGLAAWGSLLLLTGSFPSLQVRVPNSYPIGAIRYLQAHHAQGNLFTPFAYGEYAFYVLAPRIKVSLDGRLESVYPMTVFRAQQMLYRTDPPYTGGNDSRLRIPALQQAQWMLVERKFPPLPLFQKSTDWTTVYQDTQFVVLKRTPG